VPSKWSRMSAMTSATESLRSGSIHSGSRGAAPSPRTESTGIAFDGATRANTRQTRASQKRSPSNVSGA